MPENRPFLEDGSQFGVSRNAFRRMRKSEKRELMGQWFHQNFEDPGQRTTYITAEGGFVWDHGRPHDAKDQLFDKFGDLVPESLVDDVVKEVEVHGVTEWADSPYRERDEYYDPPEPPPGLFPFESFLEAPTDRYGSQQDYEARELARAMLEQYLASFDAAKRAGIGHNNPPEEIDDTETLEKLRAHARELQSELGRRSPSIADVKRLGAALRDAAIPSMKWIGRKTDLAVDTAIKATIPAIIVGLSVTYSDPLHKALDAVISWLRIVAHML